MQTQPGIGIVEEFRVEFLSCWQKLPDKGFFFVLLAGWLAMFQFLGSSTFGYVDTPSLYHWMYNAYNPPGDVSIYDDGHGLLIPFLVLGLFWWKRKELMAIEIKPWLPALGMVGAALVLHILGYVGQQQRLSVIGLFLGIYGFTGLAWGRAWLRASFFPFFLFAFMVPLGSLSEPITFPLRLLVTRLVEGICHFIFAIDVIRTGTQLVDPTNRYQYEVAAACSGIRSLVAIFLMAIIYGFISFKSAWKRVLMIASAIPLAILGNLLRMLLIILAAEIGGQDWGNFVHENVFFSLVPYLPAIFCLVGMERWLTRHKPQAATPSRA